MKKLLKHPLILLLFLNLSGCFFVAGAAAGAAAIAIVYDHRNLQNILTDTKIANKITNKIKKVPELYETCHIEVSVFNRIVLLTGQCPGSGWKRQAGEIAESLPNVNRVYNQIMLEGSTSPLTRTSDSWITTKIKSEMLATEDLKSGSIKVVTESGVVYLMGIVKHSQAEDAVSIAREVTGVQKVIKIFQYTD